MQWPRRIPNSDSGDGNHKSGGGSVLLIGEAYMLTEGMGSFLVSGGFWLADDNKAS